MLSVFAPGRGNYAYITREREWQQTVGFFGKALVAQDTLMRALVAEKVTMFPARPHLQSVARFEHFRRGPRAAGVWVVRQGPVQFALPITTGTRPGVADYLPAPHGLPGFAAPVEQAVPAGASFFEMSDGRTLVAGDGADEIEPRADGRSVRATWRRFAVIGGRSGELVEPGFEVSVEWRVDGATLSRSEILTSSGGVTIRRLVFLLPSTATSHSHPVATITGSNAIRLSGAEGSLVARVEGDLAMARSVRQIGDEPLGRGARGSTPTHVTFEATNVELRPGHPRTWVIHLTASPPAQRTTR